MEKGIPSYLIFETLNNDKNAPFIRLLLKHSNKLLNQFKPILKSGFTERFAKSKKTKFLISLKIK